MTLQEIQYKAQGIIHKWRDDDSAPYIEFVEELAHMIVPEPSKDLEEAADEMAIRAFPEKKSYSTVYDRVVDYNAVDRKNYHDGIIAGAEWQAKQGYSFEYMIQYAWGVSDTSTESKKATLSFPLPADIFEGDRVIIQIRKK